MEHLVPTWADKVLEWMWAAVAALVSAVWFKHNQEMKDLKVKLDRLTDSLDRKGDQSEIDRQRDNIAKLFDETNHLRTEIGNVRTDMATGFGTLATQIASVQGNLLAAIHNKKD